MVNLITAQTLALGNQIKNCNCKNLGSVKRELDLEKKKLIGDRKIIEENIKSISFNGEKHYRDVTIRRGEIDPYTGLTHWPDAPVTRKVEISNTELCCLKERKEDLSKLISLLDSTNMPFDIYDNLVKTKSNIKMYKSAISSYGAELNRINSEIELLRRNKKTITPGQPDPTTGMISGISRSGDIPITAEEMERITFLEAKKEVVLKKMGFKKDIDLNINKCSDIISYFRKKKAVYEVSLCIKTLNYLETIRGLWNSVK